MSSRQWRNQCPAHVTSQQRLAMLAQLLIVRQNGPTAYSLFEDDKNQTQQVFLGDPHRCSCKIFRKNRDLCLHICWVLLKKLQLPFRDPLSYQVGLLPHEISDYLEPRAQSLPKRSFAIHHRSKLSENFTVVPRRPVKEGDTCPVCLDEFSEDYSLLGYCKYSCGNAVHAHCMYVVAKYQLANSVDKDGPLTCPLCRGDFGTMKELLHMRRNILSKKKIMVSLPSHEGYSCCYCDVSPVIGSLYRCLICTQVTYCATCVCSNTSSIYHEVHGFAVKEKPEDRWKPITRIPRLNSSNCTTLPPLLKTVPYLAVKKIDTDNGVRPLLPHAMRIPMVTTGKNKCRLPLRCIVQHTKFQNAVARWVQDSYNSGYMCNQPPEVRVSRISLEQRRRKQPPPPSVAVPPAVLSPPKPKITRKKRQRRLGELQSTERLPTSVRASRALSVQVQPLMAVLMSPRNLEENISAPSDEKNPLLDQEEKEEDQKKPQLSIKSLELPETAWQPNHGMLRRPPPRTPCTRKLTFKAASHPLPSFALGCTKISLSPRRSLDPPTSSDSN